MDGVNRNSCSKIWYPSGEKILKLYKIELFVLFTFAIIKKKFKQKKNISSSYNIIFFFTFIVFL